MQAFQSFLSSSPIAQGAQFLPYFGLPFVQAPEKHPGFEHVFQVYFDWSALRHPRYLVLCHCALLGACP